jgi:hypothetical protein
MGWRAAAGLGLGRGPNLGVRPWNGFLLAAALMATMAAAQSE